MSHYHTFSAQQETCISSTSNSFHYYLLQTSVAGRCPNICYQQQNNARVTHIPNDRKIPEGRLCFNTNATESKSKSRQRRAGQKVRRPGWVRHLPGLRAQMPLSGAGPSDMNSQQPEPISSGVAIYFRIPARLMSPPGWWSPKLWAA